MVKKHKSKRDSISSSNDVKDVKLGFFDKFKENFKWLKWLDPFTYVDLYVMPIVNPKRNGLVENFVYLFFAFVFAWFLYNYVFAFLLGTSSPLVIVYSGSMEPSLYRGDIVVLSAASEVSVKSVDVNFELSGVGFFDFAKPIYGFESGRYKSVGFRMNGQDFFYDRSGPVVVYYSKSYGEDIIHRAVFKFRAPDGDFVLTYGDNNQAADQECNNAMILVDNCISPSLVKVGSLKGKYLFHLPFLGYLKLIIFDEIPRLVFGKGIR
jgi:signal peptidase I